MKVIGFKQEEIQTVYRIVAAILHLVSSLPAGVSRLFLGGVEQYPCTSSSSIFPAAEAFGRSVGWKSVYGYNFQW